MPRGMGRYGFYPLPKLSPGLIYPVIDILLLVGIIIVLIRLFIVAPVYVVALVILLLLRMLLRPTSWRYGRILW